MKKSWLLILLFIAHIAQAQYNPDKVQKKAAQLYARAIDQAKQNNFAEGIRILEQAIAVDSRFEDAYLSMAGIYGELKDYQGAIENYQKAKEIDSDYFRDYNLPYSINLAGRGDFDKALSAVEDFLSIPNLNE